MCLHLSVHEKQHLLAQIIYTKWQKVVWKQGSDRGRRSPEADEAPGSVEMFLQSAPFMEVLHEYCVIRPDKPHHSLSLVTAPFQVPQPSGLKGCAA